MLILALPSSVLKSGTNLLTAKKTSPAGEGPGNSDPVGLLLFLSRSISYDFINEVTTVVEPSSLTWSLPTSCSKNLVWPKPSWPTTAGKVPLAVLSYFVPYGFGYTIASIQEVLASVPVYHTPPLIGSP